MGHMSRRQCCGVVAVAAFLAACSAGPAAPWDKTAGKSGRYLGTYVIKYSSSTGEYSTTITIESSTDGKADAYLNSSSLPCNVIPLKKSGTSLSLDSSFECESTTTSTNTTGGTTTSGTTYTIKKLDVSGTADSLEVDGRYDSVARGSTSVTSVDWDFTGKRIANE